MKETQETKMLNIFEIVVFDMDGTLYKLDGENGTFKNSTLLNSVIANSVQFVIEKEGCRLSEAQKLINEGLRDTIGISNFLSKRYGISRGNYFDIAWNIDPKIVLNDFENTRSTIQKAKFNGSRLFLLTAAPRIWMENVLKFLNISDTFERKFHGEMFGSKDEVFEALAKEFDPTTILSVGDQFETDLKPAMNFGMSIFQINSPNDLQKLI